VFAVAPEAQLEKAKPLAEHAPQLWHVAVPSPTVGEKVPAEQSVQALARVNPVPVE
jgi:hypothetical protein